MMNLMFAFMKLGRISINGRPNLRFLKNSVAWRKRRFVFIVIHTIISVIIHFLTTQPTTHRFASPPTSPPPPPRRCTTPPTRSQPRPKVPKLRCNTKLLSKLREHLVRSGANTGNIQFLSSWKEKYFRNEAKVPAVRPLARSVNYLCIYLFIYLSIYSFFRNKVQ